MENDMNFQKICRFCLQENSNMNNLFEIEMYEDTQENLLNFIDKLTSIKISRSDGLPENICKTCKETINNVHKFILDCIMNDNKLKSYQSYIDSLTNTIELMADASDDDVECKVDVKDNVLHENIPQPDESKINQIEEVIVQSINSPTQNENTISINLEDTTSINTKTYDCIICNTVFTTKQELAQHEKEEYSLHDKFKCTKCNEIFHNLPLLKRHYKVHIEKTKENIFPCEICPKICGSKSTLIRHIDKFHAETKQYSCSECSKRYSSSSQLKVHMHVHEENYERSRYICEICSKELLRPSTLALHMMGHTGYRPFLCSTCGRGFKYKTNYEYHMLGHSDIKPHSCNYCEKSFVSKERLKNHILTHNPDPSNLCEICGKSFNLYHQLRRHKKIHNNDKAHKCETCGKSFASSDALRNHIAVHTGEKKHKCEVCEKTFKTARVLKIHKLIHTGERPYVCHICGNSFNQSATLRNHMRVHTGLTRVLNKNNSTPTE